MRQLSLPFEPEHYDERPEILVIGDAMEDYWYECDSVFISAEAPVPAVKSNKPPIKFPGGAANITANLEAMGWKVLTVYQDESWEVWGPVKLRFMYQGHQVFRTDRDDKVNTPVHHTELINKLKYAASKNVPIVVADYNKGALRPDNKKTIGLYSIVDNIPTYIHTKQPPSAYLERPKKTNPLFFYNEKESNTIGDILDYNVVVTLGANGAVHYGPDEVQASCSKFDSIPRSTCGAGDVFMAAYVTAKELYGHSNPLAIADAIAKKTVTECDYTCCVKGPIL